MDAASLKALKRAADALRWALPLVRFETPRYGAVPIEMDAFRQTKDDAWAACCELDAIVGGETVRRAVKDPPRRSRRAR